MAESKTEPHPLVTFETFEEFDDLVKECKENGVTLIACFSTTWCGPCKAIAPFLKEQAEAFANKKGVVLAKTVNADEDDMMDGLVSTYTIRVAGIPHFAVMQDGFYVKEKSWKGADRDLLVKRMTEFTSTQKS